MHPGVFLLPFLLHFPPTESNHSVTPVKEEITVVADRFAFRPHTTEIVSKNDLQTNAAAPIDDVLRQLSGFQLFRRSSSRTANPTSQGASLRGIGSNGASRVLVLYDGIPVNDPFGGWIYWGRIPKYFLSSAEIFRGGGSDLYGTNALGGIINLVPDKASQTAIDFVANTGSQKTSQFSVNSSAAVLNTNFRLSAEHYESDGYLLPITEVRGDVDHPAGSLHHLIELSAQHNLSSATNFFLRGTYYDEYRKNGTALQINSTILRQLSAGIHSIDSSLGRFSSRIFGSTQQFNQQFSIVSDDRNDETLSSSQQVSAEQVGFSADWLSLPIGVQTFQAGVDGQMIRGEVDELVTDAENAGGNQRLIGLFFHDQITLSKKLNLSFGTRFDFWRNEQFDSEIIRSQTEWSPRLSLNFAPTNETQLQLSVYRAFRAPTLNELYRPFRIGNTVTFENPNLDAELLTGSEFSYSFSSSDLLGLKATVFLMDVNHSIGNQTILFSTEEIIRRRENLGKIRSKGMEFEARSSIGSRSKAVLRYQFADSRLIESEITTLEGLRTPQVPKHLFSFNFQQQWTDRFISNLQGRYSSNQFEDDLNRFLLKRYFTLDLYLQHALSQSSRIFASCENVLNQRYELGRIPYPTLGPPRLIRIGLSLSLR